MHKRKNSLFADSEGGGHRWAVIASLVETCKLNGVEPFAYLRDVLERMVNGYSIPPAASPISSPGTASQLSTLDPVQSRSAYIAGTTPVQLP